MEFRFRQKNPHTKVWNYFGIHNVPSWTDKDKAEQYTGLEDKDGTPIFEGDIYKYIIQVHYGVKYDEFECKEIVRYEKGAFWVGNYLLIDALENDDEAKIIGNIFDNPELLQNA